MALKGKYFGKSAITNKLLAYFLLISLLPLLFLGFMTYSYFVETLEEEAITSLNAIADNKFHHIETYIIERKKNIETLAASPLIVETMLEIDEAYEWKGADSKEYRALNERIRPFLKHYMETYGYYDLLFPCIGKPKGDVGHIIFSMLHESDFETSLVTGPYKDTHLAIVFNRVMSSLETSISDFKYYAPSSEPAAFIATPVWKKGVLQGVLAAQISTEDIYELAQDYTGLGETGEIVIARLVGDKAVLVAPLKYDPQAAFTRKVAIGGQKGLPIQKAVQGKEGSGLFIDYRGKEILAAWRYLPELKWGLVVKIDTEEAFAPVSKIRTWFLMGGIITFLLVVLVAIFISRAISTPIQALQKGAEIIGSGNLDHKVGTDAKDEIGQLANAFDQMTENLKKDIRRREDAEDALRNANEEIEKWNRELEQMVEEKAEELRQSQAKLIQAEKLAALGQLGAGVAHELNSPLAGVLSLIRTYMKEKDPESLEYDDLKDMRGACEHMAGIIRGLSDFSRQTSGKFIELNCNDAIESTLNFSAHLLENRGITIEKDYDKGLPLVKGDKGQLQQVVLNMISNALDAMSEKGIFKITTRTNGQFVEMEFSDTGHGISKENIEKIFDPFFTTKRPGGGVGLGLSIVHTIVKKHNGEIRINSELGKGTTIEIRLPAVTAIG